MPGDRDRSWFGPPEELDLILDDVDVGLMPSIWEEAYGYAGVEFLAKGIPVIANAIGGMPDYTRDGETGWLNRSCSAEELARRRGHRGSPGTGRGPERRLIASRGTIVKTMSAHADEMDSLYDELVTARAEPQTPRPGSSPDGIETSALRDRASARSTPTPGAYTSCETGRR